MSCNSPSTTNAASGFPTSANMGLMATNMSVIWTEISAIQQAILEASSLCQPGSGQMCTTVAGTTPMTFLTGIESVTVLDGGLGYVVDTPSIEFIPPNGVTPTVLASANVITNGGAITGINIIDGGLGYQAVSTTLSVSTLSGVGAELTPLVDSAGKIVGVSVTQSGLGYTLNDIVTATRAMPNNIAYVNATFSITTIGLLGEILEVAVLNPGSGYEDSVTTVKITSTLNPSLLYPTGSGFSASLLITTAGVILGATITNTGQGYAPFKPYLVVLDSGSGAETSVNIDNAGIVTSVNVISSGQNYTQSATGVILNPPTALLPNPPITPAVVSFSIRRNTYGTTPSLYYQVWAGLVTNKPIQMQMSQVISYFQSLGYTITIQSNPSTGSTIQWKVCWG